MRLKFCATKLENDFACTSDFISYAILEKANVCMHFRMFLKSYNYNQINSALSTSYHGRVQCSALPVDFVEQVKIAGPVAQAAIQQYLAAVSDRNVTG